MNNIQKLISIIEKYGSDKALSGYTNLYGKLFSEYISKNINYLEIGLGTLDPSIPSTFVGNPAHYPHYKPAGILRAWKEYFENAHIYGIDVAEDCMISDDKITTFLLDSTNANLCDNLLSGISFDIILDDGLHTSDGQIKTFRNFFSKLNEGGLYVIEDIGGGGDGLNVWSDHGSEISESISSHEYFYGGNVLIIRKNGSGRGELTFDQFNTKEELSLSPKSSVEDLTIVSGLWDINRVGRDWSRYQEHFDKFLKIPCNMVLWIPQSLESFVWERRSKENTFLKIYELEDIKNLMFNPFWEKWQNIRNDDNWKSQASWLPESPQCKNEYYNPIVMSKMFFMHDTTVWNPFDTDYFVWLDAGITQTVYENYFYDEKNLKSLTNHLDPFLFLSYPYEANSEIHGFNFNAINRYAGENVDYVCRGGLFGGHKDFIPQANAEYYDLLNRSLSEGLAGTEESIFAIMAKLSPESYKRYSLHSNGLIVKFMEAISEDTVELEKFEPKKN